jgi:hypothetical protein
MKVWVYSTQYSVGNEKNTYIEVWPYKPTKSKFISPLRDEAMEVDIYKFIKNTFEAADHLQDSTHLETEIHRR